MGAAGLRLVICDDDPAVRSALRLLAEERGDVVIAEADQGRTPWSSSTGSLPTP